MSSEGGQGDFSLYLITFFSLIFGYITSEFLAAWTRLLDRPRQSGAAAVLFAWTVLCFLLMVQTWWGLWEHRLSMANDFLSFLLILVNPVAFHFLVWQLFPGPAAPEPLDLRSHLLERSPAIFCLAAAIVAKFAVDDVLVYQEPGLSVDNYIRAAAVVVLLVVAAAHRLSMHAAGIVATLALYIAYVLYDQNGA